MTENSGNAIGENLLYCQKHVERALFRFFSERSSGGCSKIERVHGIGVEEFRNRFVERRLPVLLSGLTTWSERRPFSLDYFAEKFGDSRVLISHDDGKAVENVEVRTVLNNIKKSDPKKPVYLQQWWFQEECGAVLNEVGSIEHFADDWGSKILGFPNGTLWIGSKGATTPLHVDTLPFNICSIQLFGEKEWYLLHWDAWLHEKENGEPDYQRLLEDPATHAMSGVLSPGDVLFVPHGWWHGTVTLEHSGSMNFMYVTEDIIQDYVRGILTMPLLLGLQGTELKAMNPAAYEVALDQLRKLAYLIGFDPKYAMHAIVNA